MTVRISGYECGIGMMISIMETPMGRIPTLPIPVPYVELDLENGKKFKIPGIIISEADELQYLNSDVRSSNIKMSEYALIRDAYERKLDPFDPIDSINLKPIVRSGCSINEQGGLVHRVTGKPMRVVYCEGNREGECKGTNSEASVTFKGRPKKRFSFRDPYRAKIRPRSAFSVAAMYDSDVLYKGEPFKDISVAHYKCGPAINAIHPKLPYVAIFVGLSAEWNYFLSGYNFEKRTFMPPKAGFPFLIGEFVHERNQALREYAIVSHVERVDICRGEENNVEARLTVSNEQYPFSPAQALIMAYMLDVKELYIDESLLEE